MSFVRVIFEALFGQIIKWWQGQAEKPKVTEDANTPKPMRDELNQSLDDWMRNKDRDRH